MVLGRGWGSASYFLLIGATALVAGFTVMTLSRSSPAPSRRGPSVEGEWLKETLPLRLLGSNGVEPGAPIIELPAERPALLLVFASTCPSCYANLEAWREILRKAPPGAMTLGVALERDERAAAQYASRNLPGVTVVVPGDPARFTAALGLRSVPFTLLVGDDGRVAYARRGALDSLAVVALLARLEEGP